jgi:hypothetical protein
MWWRTTRRQVADEKFLGSRMTEAKPAEREVSRVNSRGKFHLTLYYDSGKFNLRICVTGKNLRLSFDMRHRSRGAGGEFFG